MYRKDYLDKQIEQMGRVLAKLLSDLIGKKDIVEINELADTVFEQEWDLTAQDLIALPNEALIETLVNTQQFDAANLEKLADILEFLAHSNPQKSKTVYQKSLLIYQYIDTSEKVFSDERNIKINRIRKILEL